MRHKRLLHTFQGHDSFIKAMTLDPMEMFFASGSVEGDVKVKMVVLKMVDCYMFLKYLEHHYEELRPKYKKG